MNCQHELHDGARFCGGCGETVTVYDPPGGFTLDPDSRRYYRSETLSDGSLLVTWFNASTGEYEEVSYPGEQPAPTPAPLPVPSVTQKFAPPEGFIFDQNSGLYYKVMPGKDPATGVFGQWYTWFYPDTDEYKQIFYPN
jgi:hypothetical protein